MKTPPPNLKNDPGYEEGFQLHHATGGMQMQFGSDAKYLRDARLAVESFCRESGFDVDSCGEIGLVVNEAIANIIRHAYDPSERNPIQLTAQQAEDNIVLEIRDWGRGVVPPLELSKKVEADEVPTPGGLGLVCMRSWMDQVTFHPQDKGMTLRMVRSKKRLPRCRQHGLKQDDKPAEKLDGKKGDADE